MSHIKNNLDIQDHLKNVCLYPSVVYSGDTRFINDQTHNKKQYISPLLAAAVLGLNNTATHRPGTSKYQEIWTDIDAQEMYLNAKPTCYLILGKPGLGSYGLGEAISKKYHCVHLCPKNIINDEILQGSLTGKCLDFNMKHNNVCSYNTILKMLKHKLKSPAVKHRGYVISGIPLVTASKKPYCLIKTKHSEEAYFSVDEELFDLIYNLKRKKPKEKPLTDESRDDIGETGEEGLQEEEEEVKEEEEERAEEEEEVAAELPKFFLNTCSDVFVNMKAYFETQQATALHQLQELFNLDLEPDVLIYVTCPDADVVTKKYNKYINYKTGQHTAKPFITKVTPDIRWPTLYNLSDYENPHDIHVFNPKYNCRPPINFKAYSEYQVCNYRHYIFPYIEKKIMDYDPKHVIKLDGRTSIYQMMHQLSERLLLMDINPVIIPEPLYLEEAPDGYEEFWQTVEGLKVIYCDVVSFKRCASPWLNRCPVELKRRQSLVGNPKFSVMMFKHVYLMSSLPNFVSFCRNPRPYLKLRYLEPTCRIIVIGTKSSGKSMIAECLSWLFDTPVTCFKKFVEAERKKKYLTYSKTILSEIIPTIEDARFLEWQQKEQDRIASLNEWSESILALLRNYIPLLEKSIKYTKKNEEVVEKSLTELQAEVGEEQIIEEGERNKEVEEELNKGVEEEQIIEEEQGPDSTFIEEFNSFRERLSLLLPILDDVDECVSTLENKTVSQYAPLALTTITQKPSLPIIGDADVSKGITDYIAANEIQKELEPTTEELMDEMIRTIAAIDAKHKQQTNSKELYGKYIIDGLPSDPEYWEFLSSAKLIPDYTIAIMENREIDAELWHHYQNIDTCVKIHHEILLAANDPLILCKQQTKSLPGPEGVDINLVRDFVDYQLNKILETVVSTTTTEQADPDPELLASFTESIEKFREDWDSIKIRLEEKSKCFIEIELENKTDIEVLEQVLLKLRQCYYLTSAPNEDEEDEVDEDESPKDLLSYNNPQHLGETNIYCPFTYFNYGILWEGKREFSIKYDNKNCYFAKEEFLEQFQKDITKYQAYNKPFKKLPKLKICIIGCSGSGSSSISKRVAIELGLIHVDFEMIMNLYSMPRHFKKVERRNENPFTDTPIEEEGVVEFQMNEENPNLLADILSNETEMRRMIFNYYELGQPILPMIMHRIIKRLWYTYPYDQTGFVLDGYPRLLQDVEDLVQCNCIPDIVIELDCSSEIVVERLGSMKFKQWKTQLKEAKEAHKAKMVDEKKQWNRLVTVKVVVRLIIEEILETLEEPPLPLADSLSNKSFILDAHPSGSSNLDPKLFNIYNEVIAEYPEPEDTRVWEKPDEEREKIESRIEAIFETEYENIQSLKEIITDEKINMVTIDATKPFYKVLRIALAKLKNLRNRTESFFEETYIISADIADLLLSQGFCFLSKFGRLCPVSIHENPQIMLNTYKLRYKSKVFPVIHRAYVYFINGEDNVIEFRKNPLKYIISEAIKSYHPYPLRIGVIGTPKSGRSTLAAKLAKRNNLICISRGMALRRVLDTMHWTEMGSRILKNLNEGETVDDDFILNAIQTVAIDHRTVTYGFVLDGFPESPYEAQILAKDGLYPNIIFDLCADKQVILESSQNEVYYNILKYKPPYSYSFIENRFTKWSEQCFKVRKWISSDYQNICKINANESKWQCLQNAYDNIKNLTSKINYYLANVGTKVVSASAMNISNDIFKQKQSKFKNMCPACLRKNVLRYNGCPVDNSGIVEFNNKFYWICSEHMNIVSHCPRYYLFDEINIPELPAVISVVDTHTVYESGICVVTYAEGLPGQKLDTGTNKFAATYKHKTYLFCSEACLKKFLEKPHLYSDITIFQGSRWYPRLSLKKLPDLGYLEQTLANILTEACCSVNAVRPKYPGLDIQLSAVIYIALYLKTHNPKLPQAQLLPLQKAMKLFESRSRLILDLGLRMRSMENPFSSYPKCHHGSPKYNSPAESVKGEISMHSPYTQHKDFRSQSEHHHGSSEGSMRVNVAPTYNKSRRVPVPDERYDYLCEFHKPVSKVPAFLNVVDIAGLVRGAAEGQGLGNAFLSHIKACDAIFNLCRAFDDEDVIHVDGDVNPVRDLETIGEELRLKDEEQLLQNFEKLDRVVNRGGDKKLKPEYDTLQKIKTVLVDEKKHIRFGDWSAADIEVLNKHLFLTSKPALYLVNLSEKDYIRKKNKWLPKLKEWIDKNDPGAPLIPFSGAFETKLVEMDAAERQAYLKENNLSSALDKIIVQGYKALQLEYFFTAGPDEVKAWTIQKGTKAPQAAGRIHTDFEKGFIMAEVMHFKDFKEEGTEAACKAAGKYRQQGRNYVVEDGDIIFFKFNAGAGLKDAKKK